jgi:hypothetical protein
MRAMVSFLFDLSLLTDVSAPSDMVVFCVLMSGGVSSFTKTIFFALLFFGDCNYGVMVRRI